ncbi:MAG TPA: hypothetical protein VIL86_16245 [Tepidisphaeraceae bacterium]|jgi:peptidoglycan hydrolase CwlO-like protein
MAKEMMKKAAASAAESTLLSLLPSVQETLNAIRADIRNLDHKVDELRREMYDRFEQTREVINELGQRIARVEGKLDSHRSAIDRQTDKMDDWIERVVKVEMTQNARRRRAS